MRKITALEIIIVVVTLTIVFAFAFFIHGTSETKHDQATIDLGNASRALTFDLKTGQTVSGSLIYTGDTNGAWFTIYDPDRNPMVASPTYYAREGDHGSFVFTATFDGEYYLSVGHNEPWTVLIDYSYTISPPTILGVDPLVLIGLVIVIGIILELIVYLSNRNLLEQTRAVKSKQQISVIFANMIKLQKFKC